MMGLKNVWIVLIIILHGLTENWCQQQQQEEVINITNNNTENISMEFPTTVPKKQNENVSITFEPFVNNVTNSTQQPTNLNRNISSSAFLPTISTNSINTSTITSLPTNTTPAPTTMDPLGSFLPPWESYEIDIAAFLPLDDTDQGCTREAMKMAFKDVNKIDGHIKFVGTSKQKSTRHKYKLRPTFTQISSDVAEAMDKLNSVYQRDKVIVAMLGPPTKNVLGAFADYTSSLGHTHVSYTDANEPLKGYYVFFLQTPPSINYQFEAAAVLLNHFNWKQIGILYDYSDIKYHKNADAVREAVKRRCNISRETHTSTDEGIWSDVNDRLNTKQKMDAMQADGRRIILTLVSVKGARVVFCEAYRRSMYKPKTVWILFERLPKDWAKPGYDVDCTEEELLTAADGHIYIIKQDLRKDGIPSISGLTAQMFESRLQEAVGENVKCGKNLGYVYDAVWVLAELYRKTGLGKTLHNYKYFNYLFSYSLVYKVPDLYFEGLTGPVKYEVKYPGPRNIFKRLGQINYWKYKKNGEDEFVGTHHTVTDKLELIPNAKQTLFNSADVPKDKRQYTYKFSNFDEPLLIAMWLISFIGIVFALIFLALNVMLNRSKSKEENRMVLPTLNCIIIVGSILCYTSIILYGLDSRLINQHQIPSVCFVFLCTLSIGFTMTFGGLFAKTWGTYKTYFTPEVITKQAEIKVRGS